MERSAASSAYLTVSEIFPLEVRAQAISYFFAIAQVVGSTGPLTKANRDQGVGEEAAETI